MQGARSGLWHFRLMDGLMPLEPLLSGGSIWTTAQPQSTWGAMARIEFRFVIQTILRHAFHLFPVL